MNGESNFTFDCLILFLSLCPLLLLPLLLLCFSSSHSFPLFVYIIDFILQLQKLLRNTSLLFFFSFFFFFPYFIFFLFSSIIVKAMELKKDLNVRQVRTRKFLPRSQCAYREIQEITGTKGDFSLRYISQSTDSKKL